MDTEYVEHSLFRAGMWLRITFGVLRTILGLTLLKLIDVPLIDILYMVMGYELREDPTDLIFTTINSFLQHHPMSVTYFLALYVFFWGVTEIVLSVSMLLRKLWAFPLSLILVGLFVLYEIYRFTHTHSLILLGVILLDSVILWLIWKEYKLRKSKTTIA